MTHKTDVHKVPLSEVDKSALIVNINKLGAVRIGGKIAKILKDVNYLKASILDIFIFRENLNMTKRALD